jgi:hypothetical protein
MLLLKYLLVLFHYVIMCDKIHLNSTFIHWFYLSIGIKIREIPLINDGKYKK